jgi:hypothetical protein
MSTDVSRDGNCSHTNATRLTTSGGRLRARSSIGARACSGRDREERGRNAGSLARSIGSRLFLSAVALGAGAGASGSLVGGKVVGAWHLDAGSLAADVGGSA